MLEDDHSKECGNFIAKKNSKMINSNQQVIFKMEIHDDTTAVEGIKGRVDLPTLEHGLNLDCSRKTRWK